MSGFDDDNDLFDSLLDELERAASSLGSTEEAARAQEALYNATELLDLSEPSTDATGASLLREQPKSLVDLRALNFDLPLSHDPPRPTEGRALPQPGDVVDQKYEILADARRATNGFEAKHVVLRQKFILQLLPALLVEDPSMWQNFQNDIRAAGLLGHENLEFVTDLGRCPTYGAYLVKQWIEGPTLADYLATKGRRPAAEAVQFAHAVGGAIAALHEVGIIHGRLSSATVRRVEGTEGAIWKVLDVCIPGGEDLFVAPEQIRGDATGPEADQYAVALLTWQMILGKEAVLPDAEVDAIAPLMDVLRRAMSDQPLKRFADMETMLQELHRAAPRPPAPSVDPFDRREATRNVRKQISKAAASPEKPAPQQQQQRGPATGFEDRPRSMLVSLDRSQPVPRIAIDFATRARLRREYRRNIIAGGLFVPTADTLAIGTTSRVALRFPLESAAVEVDATVVGFDPGSESRPRGYGVAFDARAREAIQAFVDGLDPPALGPNSKLVVKRKLDKSAAIGAGEAFLLSRLGSGITVGSARAMFSGLPYDFDACLALLIEGAWVGVEGGAVATAPSTPTQEPEPEPAPVTSSQPTATPAKPRQNFAAHEWDDVERVLETVAYFEEQGNFMAAGRVLESAAQNAPTVPAYWHRLGLLRARFDMDLDAARAAIRRARALAPEDEEFRASERYIATLVEISAVRVLWEHDFAAEGSPHWVRSEPALGRVWLALEGRTQRTLVEVDYRTPRVEREAKSAKHIIVPQNAPAFDALEHRKEIELKSLVQRHERQIEIARRFGKLGPHFVPAPAPIAFSANATLAATSDGDFVLRSPDAAPVVLGAGNVQEARFSPDDQNIAWLVRDTGDRWSLHTSPIAGPTTRRASYEGRPAFAWTDDSAGIVVLQRRPGRLRFMERDGGSERTLAEFPGFVDLTLLTSSDGATVMIVGKRVIGEASWVARWVDVQAGRSLGDFVIPDGTTDGLVRPDGKLAATLRDGRLFLADLKAGKQKTVSTVSPAPGTVRGSWWSDDSALILVEIVDGTVRVLSIDVDLLCG